MSLNGKKILITAGPTWVPIDKVRVITNIFGGNLGVEIVKACLSDGADVTFLFGPGRASLPPENEHLKVVKFKYFDDLLSLIKTEVGSGKYDVIVHSAAVADYVPADPSLGKIKSGQDNLTISFKPTIKIVDLIKQLDPKVFLVKFKLEVGLSEEDLIAVAFRSMKQSEADLIVANEFSTIANNHKAFIIDNDRHIRTIEGKNLIAQALIEEIDTRIK